MATCGSSSPVTSIQPPARNGVLTLIVPLLLVAARYLSACTLGRIEEVDNAFSPVKVSAQHV